jgi:hypothetical protein
MKFEQFLNEKLADDLTPSQMDYYWKAIHAYNAWKKNQKNSMKVKNMLSFILMNFDLDDRARDKITNLKATVQTYIDSGEFVAAPIKHREKKETAEEPETKQEISIDETEYQTIEIDNDFCEKAFDKFNQKYFEGKLAKIPFEIKNIPGCEGQFSFGVNFRDKKFNPICIRMTNKDTWTLSSFRNTLVHEMLHYYVDCYDNGLTDEDWTSAIYYFIRGNKRKARSIIGTSDAACHSGNWLKFAKELNKKYPELCITRNSFVNYNAEHDKVKVINQLKDAYAVELLYMGTTKYPRYRLVNKEQLDKIMGFIKESPTVKLDEDGYLDYTDPTTRFISDLSISYRNPNDFTDVYVAQILNPVPLAEFPIRDLDKEPYSMGKEEWKQMNHTSAFGKLKKLGVINVKTQTKNESKEEPNFLNWLNEKAQKKWDIEKLKALGLSDEEIAKLLSGDVEEECTIE